MSTVPAGAADALADRLRAVPILFDVIYHPWPTPLAAAGVPGRVTVTGLDMLLHQAFRQFELITGVPAPVQAMRLGLLAGSGHGPAAAGLTPVFGGDPDHRLEPPTRCEPVVVKTGRLAADRSSRPGVHPDNRCAAWVMSGALLLLARA